MMSRGILKQSISCDNVAPLSPPLYQCDSSTLTSSKRNVSFKDDDALVQQLIIPGRKLTRSFTLPSSSENGYIFSPTRKARFFVGCDIGEETETSSSSDDEIDDEEKNILATKKHKLDGSSSPNSFYQFRRLKSKRRRRIIYKIIGMTIFLLLTFSLFFFKPGFVGKQAQTHHFAYRQQPPQKQPVSQLQTKEFINNSISSNTTQIKV